MRESCPGSGTLEYAFTAVPNTSYVVDFLLGGINITSLQIQEVCATLGSMQATRYRYRYNGKEQLSRFGGRYDYGFRMYDAGLARFLSVDPLTKKYPELTPYQFASNTPIQAIDLDGLEAFMSHYLIKEKGYNSAIKILKATGLYDEMKAAFQSNNKGYDIYFVPGVMDKSNSGRTQSYSQVYVPDGLNRTPVEYNNAADDYYINSWPSEKEKREKRNIRPIIISLNLDLISNSATDIDAAKDLAFVIYHEVMAHADRASEGGVESSIGEDHARFYDDSTLIGKYNSPPDQQVKSNSQAGRALKKIRSYKDEK